VYIKCPRSFWGCCVLIWYLLIYWIKHHDSLHPSVIIISILYSIRATLNSHTDVNTYSSSVLHHLNRCVDKVTTHKVIKMYPSQKPWMNKSSSCWRHVTPFSNLATVKLTAYPGPTWRGEFNQLNTITNCELRTDLKSMALGACWPASMPS